MCVWLEIFLFYNILRKRRNRNRRTDVFSTFPPEIRSGHDNREGGTPKNCLNAFDRWNSS